MCYEWVYLFIFVTHVIDPVHMGRVAMPTALSTLEEDFDEKKDCMLP